VKEQLERARRRAALDGEALIGRRRALSHAREDLRAR
jgi:hypothetical protein